jgi:hypothetical protein
LVLPLKSIYNLAMSTDIEKNQAICNLIYLHFRKIYRYIYIPHDFFIDDDFDIINILNKNEDMLFYNSNIISRDDKDRFYKIFGELTRIIEHIFNPDSNFAIMLRRWTDMTTSVWEKKKVSSFLNVTLKKRKYSYISPAYITDMFCQLSSQYNEVDKIKDNLITHLDKIIADAKGHIREFSKKYRQIIESYVYYLDIHNDNFLARQKTLLNEIIMNSLDLAEKLVKLNVYAIHEIVNGIISYYTPIDIYNQYNSENHQGKPIYIV